MSKQLFLCSLLTKCGAYCHQTLQKLHVKRNPELMQCTASNTVISHATQRLQFYSIFLYSECRIFLRFSATRFPSVWPVYPLQSTSRYGSIEMYHKHHCCHYQQQHTTTHNINRRHTDTGNHWALKHHNASQPRHPSQNPLNRWLNTVILSICQ